MTMTMTIHESADGGLASWCVVLKPVKINKHFRAIVHAIVASNLELDCRPQDLPNVEPLNYMSVFTGSDATIEDAREAAIDKAKDKWLRHRGWETEWTAHEAWRSQ